MSAITNFKFGFLYKILSCKKQIIFMKYLSVEVVICQQQQILNLTNQRSLFMTVRNIFEISDDDHGHPRPRYLMNFRGCLHEPYRKGWPYSARSRVLFEILIKNCLGLHEKRASPPRRDLAIAYPRSRLVGLEISHINATEGAGPPSRAE